MNTVSIKTIDGSQAAIELSAVEELKANFRGIILLAGDHGYESSRKIWNGMFDKKPAIIARCVGTSDVVNAIKFARENRILLSVKGGGHNSAGTASCDDGIMIDLSLMRRVTVDKQKKQ
jgi:FAD/FMN-containing dehydrogenase